MCFGMFVEACIWGCSCVAMYASVCEPIEARELMLGVNLDCSLLY